MGFHCRFDESSAKANINIILMTQSRSLESLIGCVFWAGN